MMKFANENLQKKKKKKRVCENPTFGTVEQTQQHRCLGLLVQYYGSNRTLCHYVKSREKWFLMPIPLEPGYVSFGPQSRTISCLTCGRPESGLVADARLQPTSGGEAIPTKSVISLNALACGFKRTQKPMRAQEDARQSMAGRYQVTN